MKPKQQLLWSCCALVVVTAFASSALGQATDHDYLKAYTISRPVNAPPDVIRKAMSSTAALPTWTYNVTSSRDGNPYSGIMVGTDPGTNTSTTVTTDVIPIIFKMADGGVFDPTAPDPCAGASSPTDLALVEGSPIALHANFTFGGVNLGHVQYSDAFQRANFWNASPNGGSGVSTNTNYHVALGIRVLPAITVNVPQGRGKTWSHLGCGNFGVVDATWFDPALFGISGNDFVENNLLAPLAQHGRIAPNTFPVLLMSNVVFTIQSESPFVNCCILGYHFGYIDANGNLQTYSPADFDTTGAFGPTISDTSILSHEVDEWMDDPTGGNPTPAWGHIGQQPGCQGNLEVGDALTGTNIPTVTMPNGFTYHLQELTFFSWFYGAPSLAVNNWFSDNNTFTSDAGPVCQ
jgi:hypothetical protein